MKYDICYVYTAAFSIPFKLSIKSFTMYGLLPWEMKTSVTSLLDVFARMCLHTHTHTQRSLNNMLYRHGLYMHCWFYINMKAYFCCM